MNNSLIIKYLSSTLEPIDFIEEYHQKVLPVSILFYKMCSSFPKEKLGSMKSSYKHILSKKLLDYKEVLNEEELQLILKQKNNLRPKSGQYIEFLTLSFLQTCCLQPEHLNFASVQEDIQDGWDFKYRDLKIDISTNPNKITRKGITLLVLDQSKILDQDNLILDTALDYIGEQLESLNIVLDPKKYDFTKMIINKVRDKYISLYNHQVKFLTPKQTIVVEKNIETKIEVPTFLGKDLLVSEKKIQKSAFSIETLDMAQDIEEMSPIMRSKLKKIIESLKNQ